MVISSCGSDCQSVHGWFHPSRSAPPVSVNSCSFCQVIFYPIWKSVYLTASVYLIQKHVNQPVMSSPLVITCSPSKCQIQQSELHKNKQPKLQSTTIFQAIKSQLFLPVFILNWFYIIILEVCGRGSDHLSVTSRAWIVSKGSRTHDTVSCTHHHGKNARDEVVFLWVALIAIPRAISFWFQFALWSTVLW